MQGKLFARIMWHGYDYARDSLFLLKEGKVKLIKMPRGKARKEEHDRGM